MFPERQQPGAAAAGADGCGGPGRRGGGAGGAVGHAGAGPGRALPEQHARRQVRVVQAAHIVLSVPAGRPTLKCSLRTIALASVLRVCGQSGGGHTSSCMHATVGRDSAWSHPLTQLLQQSHVSM